MSHRPSTRWYGGVVALLAMLLAGCLSRTNVGAEPFADAGPDGGAGYDASIPMPTPEDEAIAALEKALLGKWEGTVRIAQGGVWPVRYEFADDHTFRSKVERFRLLVGEYWVTDVLLDGSGVIQVKQSRASVYFDVTIRGDVLRFSDFRAGDVPDRYELERVKRFSDDEEL